MIGVLAGALVLAGATALVVYEIVRDRRAIRRRAAERLDRDREGVAYHARRSREIGDALRALGDDAQQLFPPARNGR